MSHWWSDHVGCARRGARASRCFRFLEVRSRQINSSPLIHCIPLQAGFAAKDPFKLKTGEVGCQVMLEVFCCEFIK